MWCEQDYIRSVCRAQMGSNTELCKALSFKRTDACNRTLFTFRIKTYQEERQLGKEDMELGLGSMGGSGVGRNEVWWRGAKC